MDVKLSRIKVDISSFNLIGHSYYLDLYTGSSEFLKLSHENWIEFWQCAINEKSGNDVRPNGCGWYFSLKIDLIRVTYPLESLQLYFFT